MKAGFGALLALCMFVAAFVAFMLAPLLLIAIVAGGMWWLERWGKRSRRGVGVTPATAPPARPGGSAVQTAETAASHGFGARVGKNL